MNERRISTTGLWAMLAISTMGCDLGEESAKEIEDRGGSENLYVSPSGGDDDACTSNEPCSLEEGIDRAQQGDHVVFKNGTYDLASLGMGRIKTKRAGITFRADNTHEAKIVNDQPGNPVFHVNKSNTTIEGLHFDGKDKSRGIVLHNGSYGDIRIENNVVLNASQAAIKIGYPDSQIDGVVVSGNYIEKTGTGHNAEAIYIGFDNAPEGYDVQNVEVMGNEFVLTPENGIECKMGPQTRDLSFHHNIFHTFHKQSWSDRTQTGVISCSALDVEIYRNYFHDGTVESSLLRVSPNSNMHISENIFEDISGSKTLIKSKSPSGGSGKKTIVEDNYFKNVSTTNVGSDSGWVVDHNYGLDEPLDSGDFAAFKAELLAEIDDIRGGGGGGESDDDTDSSECPSLWGDGEVGGHYVGDGIVSVSASGHSDDYIPENVLDGELGTRWSHEGDHRFLAFELEEFQTITSLDIAWFKGDQRRACFEIEVSEDGVEWTTVFAGRSEGTTKALETFDVVDHEARHVRVLGHGNSSNEWNSITELEVYASGNDEVVLTDDGTSVVASGQGSEATGAGQTLDGDLGTRWSSEGSGEWIRYDLGEERTITRLDIAWFKGDRRTASFDVQVANDTEGPWTTVHSGLSNGTTLDAQTVDVNDSAGRFVRIVGDGNSSNEWNSITEVVIRGS